MNKLNLHRIKIRRYQNILGHDIKGAGTFLLKLSFLTLTALHMPDSLASPIGHTNSFPAAAMNAEGDFIAAGNWRIMLQWNGVITRAPKDLLSNHPDSIFSVGIAHRHQNRSITRTPQPVAIACDTNHAIVFMPSSQKENIKGTWLPLNLNQKDFSSTQNTKKANLRCTMSPSGTWAVLDMNQSQLHTKTKIIDLPQIGRMATISANNSHFFIASEANGLMAITHNGDELSAYPLAISYWDNSLRMAASDTGLVLADSAYASYTTLDSDRPGLVGQSIRLPVHTGDEDYESAPSISIASDGSWIIGGFWGLWLGRKDDLSSITRLHGRIAAPRSGGFVFAHNGMDKMFMGIGSSDGDMGPLALINKAYESDNKHNMELTGFISKKLRADDETTKTWWQQAISLDQAHQMYLDHSQSKDMEAAIVAVIDSGSEIEHPGIKPFLDQNPKESLDELDNDLNGLTDDIFGYDFVQDESRPQDKHGHGSHVSGIILAQSSKDESKQDEYGIRLMSLRAIDQSGKSNSIDLSRAIEHAIRQKADVINCSWGGGRPTVALEQAFKKAQDSGAIIITSAGNDATDNDRYPVFPAAFDGVISVGAINQKGQLSDFSNWGTQSVDVLAPGEEIWSTYLDQSWAYMSGTSMAAPMVTHLAGLLVSTLKTKRPDLDIFARRNIVKDILCESAQPLAPKAKSKCGLIDAKKAFETLTLYLN